MRPRRIRHVQDIRLLLEHLDTDLWRAEATDLAGPAGDDPRWPHLATASTATTVDAAVAGAVTKLRPVLPPDSLVVADSNGFVVPPAPPAAAVQPLAPPCLRCPESVCVVIAHLDDAIAGKVVAHDRAVLFDCPAADTFHAALRAALELLASKGLRSSVQVRLVTTHHLPTPFSTI